MMYRVTFRIDGYSYVNLSFDFDDRGEALDFAELATMKTNQLSNVSIELIREEAEPCEKN